MQLQHYWSFGRPLTQAADWPRGPRVTAVTSGKGWLATLTALSHKCEFAIQDLDAWVEGMYTCNRARMYVRIYVCMSGWLVYVDILSNHREIPLNMNTTARCYHDIYLCIHFWKRPLWCRVCRGLKKTGFGGYISESIGNLTSLNQVWVIHISISMRVGHHKLWIAWEENHGCFETMFLHQR